MLTTTTPAKLEAITKADSQLRNAGVASYSELAWLLNEAIHHISATDANRRLRERIEDELKVVRCK